MSRWIVRAGATLAPLSAPALQAADIEAGKAMAQAVRAACHGANGLSASDAIPNLAGQRPAYLERQLKAWKDGSLNNPVMNAIGSQLSADDIGNVAAYFASLPAAAGAARSELLPQLAKSQLGFPEGKKAGYTHYQTINFPATRQVRQDYANPVAIQAARDGRSVPDGAYLLAEVYSAKLDADKKPVVGNDGYFVADQLLFHTAMARDKGWGQAFPDMLRNADWNYAVFTTAKAQRPGVNQAECLACHEPLDKSSCLFTLDKLTQVAQAR